MARKYMEEDVSLFGPVAACTLPDTSVKELDENEKEAYVKRQKAENEMIRKGYSRILEKVKEIRQNFSHAVTNG